jgi:hypothetical protein
VTKTPFRRCRFSLLVLGILIVFYPTLASPSAASRIRCGATPPPPVGALALATVIDAGGGSGNFSIRDALADLVGYTRTDRELDKLAGQYGVYTVNTWEDAARYLVRDLSEGLERDGGMLPPPNPQLKGPELARTLLSFGTAQDCTLRGSLLLQRLTSPRVQGYIAADLLNRLGNSNPAIYRRITDQALVDVAQLIGEKHLKLATVP